MCETSNPVTKKSNPDAWEVTSVKMKQSTKRAVKVYAAEHGKTMQSVLEQALIEFLQREMNHR
jgi:predicted transcriptional regulator